MTVQLFTSAPVTFILVLLISIFSVISFFNKPFFYKMVLHPYDIVRQHTYYKLFTADLVHIDLQHFIVNVATLFFVGGNMERHLRLTSGWGSLQFLVIYVTSLLIGSVIILILHRNDIAFSSAGASGSIMGCVFGFMYLEPTKTAIYLPGVGAVTNEYYALIYVALMVLLKKRITRSGANYELHFWGALGGIIITILIAKFT